MTTEVRDYISVIKKLEKFGADVPDGLAILPENLDTANSVNDLYQHVEADTVRTLLKTNNIEYIEPFKEDKWPAYLLQYNIEWFGPSIFISASFISQNPHILSIILGIISNYLYDLFKSSEDDKVSLTVIFQNEDGICKKIDYKGSQYGLDKISNIVEELKNER